MAMTRREALDKAKAMWDERDDTETKTYDSKHSFIYQQANKLQKKCHKDGRPLARKPNGTFYARCEPCLIIERLESKKMREINAEQGRCKRCSAPLDDPQYKTCMNCRDSHIRRQVSYGGMG